MKDPYDNKEIRMKAEPGEARVLTNAINTGLTHRRQSKRRNTRRTLSDVGRELQGQERESRVWGQGRVYRIRASPIGSLSADLRTMSILNGISALTIAGVNRFAMKSIALSDCPPIAER
jgi:hypothetical protein